MRSPVTLSIALLLALCTALAAAAPMPSPVLRRSPMPVLIAAPMATPQPRALSSRASVDEVYDFYKPVARWADAAMAKGEDIVQARDDQMPYEAVELRKRMASEKGAPTPVKRSDIPSVPVAQLGPPSFPAQYPSCYNCEQKYSSLSSCMEASSVFQNASSIFNSPLSYIAVIKCACTDTFQAVYPQCLQCFQMTNQCQYLGTDPKGTGAGSIVTNIRQICAFGSSLLGGAEHANYPDYNNTFTPSTVPGYTDVTTSGEGYYDQSTGAIFGAARRSTSVLAALPLIVCAVLACLSALIML